MAGLAHAARSRPNNPALRPRAWSHTRRKVMAEDIVHSVGARFTLSSRKVPVMTVVRLRYDILRADRATADRWYITNGSTAVGPVALELVERAIEAGKIPVESYIRHELWKIWRPLSELCVTEGP